MKITRRQLREMIIYLIKESQDSKEIEEEVDGDIISEEEIDLKFADHFAKHLEPFMKPVT